MLEYIAITMGLIIFGDAVLVPAVYLALFGHLNLNLILLISFMVSNLMSVWWYHIGKMELRGLFKSLSFIERYEKNHPQTMSAFFKHQLKIVFLSRFLHGSGISILTLSGIYHVPFKKFMAVNIMSSIIVITAVPVIVFFAKTGASAVFDNIKIVEGIVAGIALLVFILIKFEFLGYRR